jgi:hypothetical protein
MTVFTQLIEKGILCIDDEIPDFVSRYLLYYALSQFLIISKTFSAMSTQELMLNLEQIRGERPTESYKEWWILVCFVITMLINSYERKELVIDLVGDKVTNSQYWIFFEPINMAIPLLKLKVEEFSVFLIGISERISQDYASGSFYLAVYQVGCSRPEFALKIVDYCISIKAYRSGFLIESLLHGASTFSLDYLENVIRLVEEWINSGIDSLCQIGLNSLWNLTFEEKYDVIRFMSLAKSQIPDTRGQISLTLSLSFTRVGMKFPGLTSECYDQLKILKEIGKLGDVNHGIALALIENNSIYNEFFTDCLNLLCDTPTENKGTIKIISNILLPLTSSNPLIVWKFLEGWVLCHEKGESVSEYNLFLYSIQYAFRANIIVGYTILTKWFISDDLRLIEEARKIIIEIEMRTFSFEVLASLSKKETIYIIEKLLVGYFESHQIFHLFFSIVGNTKHSIFLRDYFIESLSYLAKIYPGASTEVYKEYLSQDNSSKVIVLIRQVTANLAEYQEKIKSTRYLIRDELSGSKIRSRKFHEFKNKKMQSVSRSEMESDRFPLQKLIPMITIGRGDRSFQMNIFNLDPNQRHSFSTPHEFQEYSQTFELPISELIDPEGEILRRVNRLNLHIEDIMVNDE